jgi:RNA polymerase sigma-70 factor (ECF subfamily)
MPPRERSQLDLDMARLADGDREAFSAVFRALWPVLVPFCHRALGSGADVDDAAQLTLEKIFARASDYDPSRPALPWALTIATWECATLRRKRQRSRIQGSAEVEAAPSQAQSPEDQTLTKELEAALRATMDELPPADRETLDAAFFDETLQGAASPAFRKRKERAVSRLRNLWRKLRES